MPAGSDPIRGAEAIQKFWQGALDSGVAAIRLKTIEVFGHGPTATEVGEYELRDKAGVLDHGKYIVVWQHADGKWKLLRDMFSTNVPPPKKVVLDRRASRRPTRERSALTGVWVATRHGRRSCPYRTADPGGASIENKPDITSFSPRQTARILQRRRCCESKIAPNINAWLRRWRRDISAIATNIAIPVATPTPRSQRFRYGQEAHRRTND